MVIILPNFFLQKPVCRLLAVMGFLGFSGAIASQSSSPVNIDSVETYMKKDSFEKNVGSRFVTNRSIDSFGVSDTVDIKMLQRSQFLSIQQLLKGNVPGVYTTVKVKEMPPKEFEEFHGITADEKKEKADFISLLKHAPKVFWTVGLVQFFCWAAFMYMWTYTNGAIAATVWGTTDVQSAGYQEAGNWVGVLFAVQAIGSVIWAVILPLFKARKQAYAFSLVLGGIGFISTLFFHNEYLLFISYLLIGCAWAAMLAMPFTILTNSVSGKNMGAYLGLFNGTICVPQIAAALVGGGLLHLVGGHQVNMLVLAGVLLIAGAVCVYFIKETMAHHEA